MKHDSGQRGRNTWNTKEARYLGVPCVLLRPQARLLGLLAFKSFEPTVSSGVSLVHQRQQLGPLAWQAFTSTERTNAKLKNVDIWRHPNQKKCAGGKRSQTHGSN